MIKQKRGFFTFIFSFIPGAGELYMGFRKQGISIMGIFWLTIGLASMLRIDAALFILPILWFYSFFNVHNLASLTEEEFYSLEDNFILDLDKVIGDKNNFIKNYRNAIAAILIFLGVTMIWNNCYSMLYNIFPEHIRNIVYRIGSAVPQVIVAVAIIFLGIYLIRGKKKELDNNENS